MTTDAEFNKWAADLRQKHPEMFGEATSNSRRRTARKRWHPLFLRVYGIRPWEMGRYTLREYGDLVEDLERHGLGGL